MKTYKLTPEGRQKERDKIWQILLKNKYDAFSLKKSNKEKERKKKSDEKWAKFTYVGKVTEFITKLFKDTNVKIAFTTDNTIEKASP